MRSSSSFFRPGGPSSAEGRHNNLDSVLPSQEDLSPPSGAQWSDDFLSARGAPLPASWSEEEEGNLPRHELQTSTFRGRSASIFRAFRRRFSSFGGLSSSRHPGGPSQQFLPSGRGKPSASGHTNASGVSSKSVSSKKNSFRSSIKSWFSMDSDTVDNYDNDDASRTIREPSVLRRSFTGIATGVVTAFRSFGRRGADSQLEQSPDTGIQWPANNNLLRAEGTRVTRGDAFWDRDFWLPGTIPGDDLDEARTFSPSKEALEDHEYTSAYNAYVRSKETSMESQPLPPGAADDVVWDEATKAWVKAPPGDRGAEDIVAGETHTSDTATPPPCGPSENHKTNNRFVVNGSSGIGDRQTSGGGDSAGWSTSALFNCAPSSRAPSKDSAGSPMSGPRGPRGSREEDRFHDSGGFRNASKGGVGSSRASIASVGTGGGPPSSVFSHRDLRAMVGGEMRRERSSVVSAGSIGSAGSWNTANSHASDRFHSVPTTCNNSVAEGLTDRSDPGSAGSPFGAARYPYSAGAASVAVS